VVSARHFEASAPPPSWAEGTTAPSWAALDVERGFGTLAAKLGVNPGEQVDTVILCSGSSSNQTQRGTSTRRTCVDGVRGEDRLYGYCRLTPARGAPIRVQIRSAADWPLQFPFVFVFAQPRRRHSLPAKYTWPNGSGGQNLQEPGHATEATGTACVQCRPLLGQVCTWGISHQPG
jgi:hypothetical protein